MPNITAQLRSASENLKQKMLDFQNLSIQLQTIKTKIISITDPIQKDRYASAIKKLDIKVKAAEKQQQDAENVFQSVLEKEPDEEMYDLLDHTIKEEKIRSAVRKIISEIKINEDISPKVKIGKNEFNIIGAVQPNKIMIIFDPIEQLEGRYEDVQEEITNYIKKQVPEVSNGIYFSQGYPSQNFKICLTFESMLELMLKQLK